MTNETQNLSYWFLTYESGRILLSLMWIEILQYFTIFPKVGGKLNFPLYYIQLSFCCTLPTQLSGSSEIKQSESPANIITWEPLP